jgi:hypothetical protein
MPLLGHIQLRDAREIREATAVDERFDYLASSIGDRRVNVRHPGYGANHDLLFSLHTPDDIAGGVHYGLVLDACGIIADNRRDGWLSHDREGRDRVEGDVDDILSRGDYWYNLPPTPGME